MNYINQLMREYMPAKKRGHTKFITTNKVSHWNKLEVIDNVR